MSAIRYIQPSDYQRFVERSGFALQTLAYKIKNWVNIQNIFFMLGIIAFSVASGGIYGYITLSKVAIDQLIGAGGVLVGLKVLAFVNSYLDVFNRVKDLGRGFLNILPGFSIAKNPFPGIRNDDGSSCFLNSIIHVIRQIPELKRMQPFRNFIRQYEKDLKKGEKISSSSSLDLRLKLHNISDEISDTGRQEDASAVFDIISGLAVDNNVRDISYQSETKYYLDERGEEIACTPSSHRVFGANIKLSVDGSRNVQDLLRTYFSQDISHEGNYVVRGGVRRRVVRQTVSYNRAPNTLMLTMKRFDNHLQKNNSAINLPDQLTLPKEQINGWFQNSNYELQAFIEHRGSFGWGHYVAYVKINNEWYLFDDSYVSKVSEREKNSAKKRAYLCLYRRS